MPSTWTRCSARSWAATPSGRYRGQPRFISASTDPIKPYPYDPERAKKLLAEAGYPSGFEITLNTYSGTITSMDQMADALTGYLAKVGITLKRRHIEDVGMWTSSSKEGKLEGIQYYSWGSNSIFDADAILYALTYSKEPLSYTKDAALDQFLDEGRTQIDPKKRLEAYAKAQKLLHEKFYWIPSTSSTPSRESTRSSTTRRAATR